MGAAPSRGISLRNPEPPGKIIQITEDVAKRMTSRYGPNTEAGDSRGPTAGGRTEAELATEAARSPVVPASSSVPQQGGLFNVGPRGFPVVETVSAYEIRQQKDEELRQNDDFWTSKLRDLEARYVAAAFAADGVFNKELEKLDKLVPKPMEPVCQEHTVRVAQCYKDNSKQALKCSNLVREFALCVEQQIQMKVAPSAA